MKINNILHTVSLTMTFISYQNVIHCTYETCIYVCIGARLSLMRGIQCRVVITTDPPPLDLPSWS